MKLLYYKKVVRLNGKKSQNYENKVVILFEKIKFTSLLLLEYIFSCNFITFSH